jgi:hypothetical protein
MTDVVEQALLASIKVLEDAARTVPLKDFPLFEYLLDGFAIRTAWPWEKVKDMQVALMNARVQVPPTRPLKNLRTAVNKFRPDEEWLPTDRDRQMYLEQLKSILATWRELNGRPTVIK